MTPGPATQREAVRRLEGARGWIEQDGAGIGEGGERTTAGDGDPARAPANQAVGVAFLTRLQRSLTLAMRPEPSFPHLENGDNFIQLAESQVCETAPVAQHRQ